MFFTFKNGVALLLYILTRWVNLVKTKLGEKGIGRKRNLEKTKVGELELGETGSGAKTVFVETENEQKRNWGEN